MLLLNYHLIPSILVIIMAVIIIVIVITSIQLSSSWRSYILCFVIFIPAFITMLHCQIFLGTPFIVSFIIYSMLAFSMVFFHRHAGWKLNYKINSDITIESTMKKGGTTTAINKFRNNEGFEIKVSFSSVQYNTLRSNNLGFRRIFYFLKIAS